MNTFLYSYLVVILMAIIFLCYVHRATIKHAFKLLAKELAELGANAGHAMRH